jgi:hypothetical protein
MAGWKLVSAIFLEIDATISKSISKTSLKNLAFSVDEERLKMIKDRMSLRCLQHSVMYIVHRYANGWILS